MPVSPKDAFDAYVSHGRHRAAAAEAVGLHLSSFNRRLNAYERETGDNPAQLASSPSAVAEKAQSRYDRKIIALEDDNTNLRRELKQAVRDGLDTEKVRREIIGIADYSPAAPLWVTDITGRDHSGPGTPMVIWSDWHWAEVVKPEEVGGVNEYNLEIAKRRARRLVDLIVKLAFNHQVQQGYPGIVVMLGGDMITGEIHQELAESNELKTIPAVWDLFNVLVAAIEELARHFGRVFLPSVVGNHGRNTLKPRMKGKVHTNFEWLLYVMLERHFSVTNPNVQFMVPNDIDVLFKVNDSRYLLTHGDAMGVKGGDGIIGALGPIMRGKIKVSHSNQQVGRDFDTMVIGHWHQYLPLPGVIVNGSLKGYDEFARTALRASYQQPIQAMWYDHPLVGITKHEPLYLDGLRHPNTNGSWVSWVDGGKK